MPWARPASRAARSCSWWRQRPFLSPVPGQLPSASALSQGRGWWPGRGWCHCDCDRHLGNAPTTGRSLWACRVSVEGSGPRSSRRVPWVLGGGPASCGLGRVRGPYGGSGPHFCRDRLGGMSPAARWEPGHVGRPPVGGPGPCAECPGSSLEGGGLGLVSATLRSTGCCFVTERRALGCLSLSAPGPRRLQPGLRVLVVPLCLHLQEGALGPGARSRAGTSGQHLWVPLCARQGTSTFPSAQSS